MLFVSITSWGRGLAPPWSRRAPFRWRLSFASAWVPGLGQQPTRSTSRGRPRGEGGHALLLGDRAPRGEAGLVQLIDRGQLLALLGLLGRRAAGGGDDGGNDGEGDVSGFHGSVLFCFGFVCFGFFDLLRDELLYLRRQFGELLLHVLLHDRRNSGLGICGSRRRNDFGNWSESSPSFTRSTSCCGGMTWVSGRRHDPVQERKHLAADRHPRDSVRPVPLRREVLHPHSVHGGADQDAARGPILDRVAGLDDALRVVAAEEGVGVEGRYWV
jgi:hypothetical protein